MMHQTIRLKLLPVGVCLLVMLFLNVAQSGQIRTNDPLKAFVNQKYALGDDYYYGIDGIALSEISIWGTMADRGRYFEKPSPLLVKDSGYGGILRVNWRDFDLSEADVFGVYSFFSTDKVMAK